MYQIDQEDLPEEFLIAYQIAGYHLQTMGQGSVKWIRANLNKPFIEHLSFSIGNQLFFVYIEIDTVPFEPHKQFFLDVCKEANATPCLLQMNRTLQTFEPSLSGWGLVNVITNQSINPLEMVTDELIPMTQWELHDFGIQVVRNHIQQEGHEITSSQSSLHIDPNIWFKDKDTSEMCWVVVRVVKYPKSEAERPHNLDGISKVCEKMSSVGYFASVVIANKNETFDPLLENSNLGLPIYRGHPASIKFVGLDPL